MICPSEISALENPSIFVFFVGGLGGITLGFIGASYTCGWLGGS